MARLDEKVAFITGAGSGIGRAAARIFAREGARVVIAELKRDLGLEAEKLVKEAGGDATFVETDVTDEDSVRHAIQATVAQVSEAPIVDLQMDASGIRPRRDLPPAGRGEVIRRMPGGLLYPAGHFARTVRLAGKVPLTSPQGWV